MTYDEIVAECIEKIEQGASVEACVSVYPEHAETLVPTLYFVQSLREVNKPMMSNDGFNRGRAEVSHAASEGNNSSVPFLSGLVISLRENYLNTMPALRWAVAGVAALLLVFGSLGAVQASDDSLPGSPLYSVKRAGESVRALFVSTPESRARWHATLAERRLQEALRLSQSGRQVDPQLLAEALQHIQAAIAASSDVAPAMREELQRNWVSDFERLRSDFDGTDGDGPVEDTVDGVIGIVASPTPTATVTATAEPTATATASATATRPATATTAPATEIEFEGTLESMSATQWVVAGRTLRITAVTEIKGDLNVGDRVKVHARPQADGTLVVREIELADDERNNNDDDNGQVDEIEFEGTLESMSATQWVVAGRTLRITAATEIKDDLNVGDRVKVHAQPQADGALVVREIELAEDERQTDNDDNEDNSGPGNNNDDDEDGEDNSGPSNNDDDEDNSGPGNNNDDDDGDDDNSGPGSNDDDDDDDDNDDGDEDRSGSNSGSDDDDSDDDDSDDNSDDTDDSDDDDDGDDDSSGPGSDDNDEDD